MTSIVLQVVMSPHEILGAYVDNYIKLLPESDVVEFQKILEMKVIFLFELFVISCGQ